MADLDDDLAFALYIQEQLDKENSPGFQNGDKTSSDIGSFSKPTSIVDPSWELIDPIPDIRQLFLQFNDTYFDGLLAGVEVRWSPRMTLCAGLCCYEGRGGLCSIRLSEPLLKLRPRKDLVETLLHEMIHALLFVTDNNKINSRAIKPSDRTTVKHSMFVQPKVYRISKDHDGHGPEFLKHMHRINKETGTNISVFHNFHDEVDSYRQHWWKCDGPCQKRPPYFGVVRRAMNRAPSPRDPWWADHQRFCGGTYHKIKEPENYGKKGSKSKAVDSKSKNKEKSLKKEKNISTLDKFLDKRKRESGGCSDDGSTSENDTKRFKSTDENHGLDNVVAFSGSGYALGSATKPHSENSKGKDSQKAREPLLQKAFHKKTEQDNDGSNDTFQNQNSCLKTVREKWLAKWEKEKGLNLGANNNEKDKSDCKSSSIKATLTSESSSKKELNESQDRKNKNEACRKNDPSHNKIESPNDSRKNNPQCMTTEEAFKTAITGKVIPKVESAAQATPVLGSSEKPIELLENSQLSMNRSGVKPTYIDLSEESPLKFNINDQLGESLPPLANSTKIVACPACTSLVLETHINDHLDQCLQ